MKRSRRNYNTRNLRKGWKRKKTFPRDRMWSSEEKWKMGLKIHLACRGKERTSVIKSLMIEHNISRSYCYKLWQRVKEALSNPSELMGDISEHVSETIVPAVVLDKGFADRILEIIEELGPNSGVQ